jgi:hypothetical protein
MAEFQGRMAISSSERRGAAGKNSYVAFVLEVSSKPGPLQIKGSGTRPICAVDAKSVNFGGERLLGAVNGAERQRRIHAWRLCLRLALNPDPYKKSKGPALATTCVIISTGT